MQPHWKNCDKQVEVAEFYRWEDLGPDWGDLDKIALNSCGRAGTKICQSLDLPQAFPPAASMENCVAAVWPIVLYRRRISQKDTDPVISLVG